MPPIPTLPAHHYLNSGHGLASATPAGDFVTADAYKKLFTLHGVIMVFLFLLPSIRPRSARHDRTVAG